MSEDQVTHTPSVLESLRNLVGLAENRCTRLWRYKAALDDARAAIAAAEQAVLAVNAHDALTARVAELEAENERLRAENAKMWGALEAQEQQSHRGLFNMTSEEIEHVHKLRRAILNRNASEGEK